MLVKILVIGFALISNIAFAQIDRPNPDLTPGDVMNTDLKTICVPNYSLHVRNVSEGLKKAVYVMYKVPVNERGSELVNGKLIEISKIDHLIPLAIGGSNSIYNLWPHYFNVPSGMGVLKKNVIENLLHHKVCTNKIDIIEAQRCISEDWIACYNKHVLNEDNK